MKSSVIFLFMAFLFSCGGSISEKPAKSDTENRGTPASEATTPEQDQPRNEVPEVSFQLSSEEVGHEEYTEENPVGYVYTKNILTIVVGEQLETVDAYNCTQHGAGTCGEAGKSEFEASQLRLPRSISGRKILAEIIVGAEIERAWSRYNRYIAVYDNNRVSVYRFTVPDAGSVVDESDVQLMREIVTN